MEKKALLHLFRDPKRVRALILFTISLAALLLLVYVFPPTTFLIVVFHILLFFSIFLFVTALCNGAQHGFIIGGGLTLYVLLRFLHLRHPLYAILIVVTIISLELYWKKR